ncbi:dihydrolipoyl dehydrogenase family protein [Arenibaculum pallidiluteum]|uniref:dihydrolipoyl dehydrogenase family protein n=1 Tax=Arenibaculum pallidiluteum TaxID=2812559 RepID=UPI001A95A6BA|nr:FAD-dependent oxidoreductase [Arenibaculum pallidiluteum]
MSTAVRCDLCVIGAGSGGLSVAAGAARLGASVVLIEKGEMGGDCLNTGCVPSKSLLAAAKAARSVREAARLGIDAGPPEVDFARVRRHVAGVIASIAPHDSQERFEGLGVRVIRARACFTAPDRVEAGGLAIQARRFVIATGSRAAVPDIPGLDAVPFLTNETVFGNPDLPDHLVVIGGGPVGLEMAQAHRRLGSRVTVIQSGTLLPRDEPEHVAALKTQLEAEGIRILEGTRATRVAGRAGAIAVHLPGGEAVEGSHLLVAAGRSPNVEELGLEAAGIALAARGVRVDDRLRTTNRRVFAVGDVAGGPQFTHVAGYHAGIVIRNALFRLPARVDYRALPWVTYTGPELAQVGLTEARARAEHGAVRVLRASFAGNDRARAEGAAHGGVKAVVTPRGRILGASILGEHAGEDIQPWVLAIQNRLRIGAMAQIFAPYPTLGEASRQAAGTFFEDRLFGPRVRGLVRLLARLG